MPYFKQCSTLENQGYSNCHFSVSSKYFKISLNLSTAGLLFLETHTNNQFSNKPEGLRQDPSPPKAMFTRVLKVPTRALDHLLLPPNLPASDVQAVPKHQTFLSCAQTFIAWLLSRLAQVLLVHQQRSSPPNPGLSLRRSVLTVSLQS